MLYIGKNWFKDTGSGTCYHMVRGPEGELMVSETKQNRPNVKVKAQKATATAKSSTRVDIECKDCGATRNIATQDKFQVTRCAPCQEKHRTARRKELNKARREKKKGQEESTS